MFKRLLLIGLLCMGLIALVSTETQAGCVRYANGATRCTSICPQSYLIGVGNPDISPVAVCVGLAVTKASVWCRNKGENAETAKGRPFSLFATISGVDFVQLQDLTGQTGKAFLEQCWSDTEVYNELKDYIPTDPDDPNFPCQNRNWYVLPGEMTVEEVYVYYQAYVEDTKKDLDFCMDLSDSICRYCTRGVNETGCYYDCKAKSVDVCKAKFNTEMICGDCLCTSNASCPSGQVCCSGVCKTGTTCP